MGVAKRRVIPQWLWTLGESGTWLDFAPSYTFTDTAGTTPAGAGDFIANAGDRSPNSADAVQGTSAARWQLLQTGGGVYYASTDETDDVLPVTLPAITGGTVALVGLNGIYYEEDWDYAGGTLSIGPTSVPGLPSGILDVVGGLCAVLITDRALTAAEKAAVSAWGKARGAAGVFELGPELVTNGAFDTDVSGWSALDAGSVLGWQSPGLLRIEAGDLTPPGATNSGAVSAEIGAAYIVSWQLVAVSSGYPERGRVLFGGFDQSHSGVEEARYAITATTTAGLTLSNRDTPPEVGAWKDWDNVSVRKLELVP